MTRWRAGWRAGAAAAVTGVSAAAGARVAYATLRQRPPGGPGPWTRTNHRGETVTLLEGPAVAAAAIAATAVAPGLRSRSRLALMLAGAAAAALGGYDDLAGRGGARGFRGHLGALARGELTTGTLKLAGITAAGLCAALVHGGEAEYKADAVVNAGLMAAGANLLNLFDLRPGRAIKVAILAGTLLAAAPAPAGTAAAAPLGAAVALLPEDLAERAMLGDAGANALGAMLGTAASLTLSRRTRMAALGVILVLTAASERISFTTVIESTPLLRRLDMLGRPPAAAPAVGAARLPAAPPPAPAVGAARLPTAHSRPAATP
jgi:UDP-GlcNAc:undecaprenyl-phosphate GlcNAc-1-phosphate transferase